MHLVTFSFSAIPCPRVVRNCTTDSALGLKCGARRTINPVLRKADSNGRCIHDINLIGQSFHSVRRNFTVRLRLQDFQYCSTSSLSFAKSGVPKPVTGSQPAVACNSTSDSLVARDDDN